MNLFRIVVSNPDNLKEYPYMTELYQNGFSIELSPVTIITGENGIGKSTLLESVASKVGFSSFGGTSNHEIVYSRVNQVINNFANKPYTSLEDDLLKNFDKNYSVDIFNECVQISLY